MKRLLALPAILLALPAILLVLAAFAIFALPYLIPSSYLQSQIAPLLAREGITLRKLDRIVLTFNPEFGVAVHNVETVAPGIAGRETHFKASRIVISPYITELDDDKLRIRKIRLEKPVLTVRGQFMPFAQAGSDAPQMLLEPAAFARAQTQAAPRLDRFSYVDVDIIDGTANILNRSGKLVLSLKDAALALRHMPEQQPILTIDGSFSVNGEKLNLKVAASPKEKAAPFEVTADLRTVAAEAKFEGDLDFPLRVEGTMRSTIVSGKELARWIDGDPAALNRLTGALFEGRVNVTGAALELTDGHVSAPSVKSDLAMVSEYGRRFEVVLANGEIYGGASQARFELVWGESEANMAASLKLTGVDSEAIGRDLPGFDWLSGPVNSELQVTGKGRSWRKILESLTGQSAFSVHDGAVEGIDMSLIVSEAKEGRFEAWERQPGYKTPFDVIEASFDIKNGIGRTTDLRMTGPGIDVAGRGSVNFARQRLNYKLQTRINSHAGGSEGGGTEQKQAQFSLPLIVKGDWENPSILPDVGQMLRDPDSISGTGELIGKSLEQLTRGNGKSNGLNDVLNGLFGKKAQPEAGVEADANGDETDE